MSYIGAPNSNASSGLKSAPGYRTLQKFTPDQMKLFKQMFGQVGPDSYLSRLAGGDEELFSEMEAPALKQFSGLQGNIASRFSGMGMGGRRSSGFQNTMGAEASDFAQQLQSNRQSLQRQAIQDLMGMSNSLLGQDPYMMMQKRQKEKSGNWGGLIGAGVGGAIGLMGGPIGATAGASMGSQIGAAF